MTPLDDFEARHAREMEDWRAVKDVTAVIVKPPIADGRFRRLLADAGFRGDERKWAEHQLRSGSPVRLTAEHQSQLARLVGGLKRGGYEIELIRDEMPAEAAGRSVAVLSGGAGDIDASPVEPRHQRSRLVWLGGLGALAAVVLVIAIASGGDGGDDTQQAREDTPPAVASGSTEQSADADNGSGPQDGAASDKAASSDAAGSSGAGGPSGNSSGSGAGGFSGAEADAYRAAESTCRDFGVAETARQLGLPASSSPDEVAQAYAEEMSVPSFQPASFDGCLAGLS